MKLSLKDRIYRWLLHNHGWFHGESLTKLGQEAGYEGETCRRRLRELVEEGKVVTETRKGVRAKSNWYKVNI